MPLKETPEGIWCIQQNKGIVLYSRQGRFKQQFSFFEAGTFNNILQSEHIFYAEAFASNDNFIYINDLDKNILCINTVKKTSSVINVGKKLFSIGCLFDKVYIAENYSLIIISDNGFGKKIEILLDSSENIAETSLKQEDETHFFLSRNWHLYNIDTSGKIEYELTERDKNSFVKNGNIQKIYPDKFNRIWILSNNEVKRIENAELVFQNFTYADKQNNFTRSLYYDEQKNILLAGGYKGMIQAYDSTGNPLWAKAFISNIGEYLLNIEKLSRDEYLVVPTNDDLFIFNSATRKVYPLRTSLQKSILQNVQTIYPNNLQRLDDTTILLAANNNVFKCIFKTGLLTYVAPLIPDVIESKLTCFVYTGNKTLWTGMSNGSLHIVSGNKIKNLQIPGNYPIRSIAENELHQVCIGTEKGLFIYSDTYKLVKKIDNSSGLRNDCIYAIAVSGKDLFVSTKPRPLMHWCKRQLFKIFLKKWGCRIMNLTPMPY